MNNIETNMTRKNGGGADSEGVRNPRGSEPLQFPPLRVEFLPDGLINLVDPTDDGSGNIWAVLIHPAQLRTVAENAGLTGEVTAPAADLVRAVTTLKRQMLMVRDKALDLQLYMAKHSDWKHADLNCEMHMVNGLVDMLDVACDPFEDDFEGMSRQVTPCNATDGQSNAERVPAKTSETGGLQGPQRRVASVQLELGDSQ